MKKKLLTLLMTICFIVPCMILLGACGNSTPSTSSITVTFETEIGQLSFSTKKIDISNDQKSYLSFEDCPKISNEGDNKIFDSWVKENGENFDFSLGLTEDIKLFANFKDASLVAKASWTTNQSILSKRMSIHSIALGSSTEISQNRKPDITYEKVANDQIIANDYVTKQEIENVYQNACFLTSADSVRLIKKADLTTATYRKEVYVVINPIDDVVRSVGYFDYVPKGVAAISGNDASIGVEVAWYNSGIYPTSSGLYNVKSKTYLGQNTQLTNDQIKINNIKNYSVLSQTETYDTYDHYFIFIEVDGFKFSYRQSYGEDEHYYYTLPNDGRLRECTKTEYDSVEY